MKMELSLHNLNLSVASFHFSSRSPKPRVSFGSLSTYRANTRSRETVKVLSALPETAASVAVAATVVGAAATFLMRRTKSSEVTELYADVSLTVAVVVDRLLLEHAMTVEVQVYARNAMVKDLCSRDCPMKALKEQD